MSTQTRFALNVPATVLGYPDLVPTDLEWSVQDPATVRITFRDGDEPVSWLVARELLFSGVGSQDGAGDGDVRVGRGGDAGSTLIVLSPPGDEAVITIPTAALVEFLDGCEDICPAGGVLEDERLAVLVDLLLIAWGLM